jgi:hypothetical protein
MSLFGWLEQIICNEDDVIQLVLSICNEIWWIETRDALRGVIFLVLSVATIMP